MYTTASQYFFKSLTKIGALKSIQQRVNCGFQEVQHASISIVFWAILFTIVYFQEQSYGHRKEAYGISKGHVKRDFDKLTLEKDIFSQCHVLRTDLLRLQVQLANNLKVAEADDEER
jgi:hypothetical protein